MGVSPTTFFRGMIFLLIKGAVSQEGKGGPSWLTVKKGCVSFNRIIRGTNVFVNNEVKKMFPFMDGLN